jgi:hypothetical protein
MGTPRGFAPRVVGLDEFFSLLQQTGALLGAAPARLCGLFLLVFLPVQLLSGVPYAAMPLRFSIAAVGLSGYFVALEAARAGRVPGLLNMLAPWRLPAGKLILLVVSGLLPLLCVLLVWWFDLGWEAVDSFLGGAVPADGFTMRQELEFVLVFNLVGTPLLFIQPLCVLYSWSASRCLSANLLAAAANWRWALALALISIPIAIGLDAFDQKSAAEMLLCLVADVAIQMGMGAFTLVLLQRALR